MGHLESFATVPIHRALGIRLVSRDENPCSVAMPASASHLQGEGLIQGGIVTALADTAAVYVLLPDLREGESCTSIEFKLNFLAPARADGGEMIAKSRLIRRGRRIAVLAVDVEQAGVPTATGLFTYMFFERRRS